MDVFSDRLAKARARMEAEAVDCLLVAPSPDLLYLSGFEGHISERLTVLVVPAEGRAVMVLPAFEARRFVAYDALFGIDTWEETDDPYRVLAAAVGPSGEGAIAVSDTQWARFLLGFQETFPEARFVPASRVLAPLRLRKRPEEVEALRRVSRLADAAFAELVALPLAGLGERQLSRKLGELLLDAGNEAVGFATVAGGPHSASPHHTMTDRPIRPGDALLFDFGGRTHGYYADVTRTVVVGSPPEGFEEVYAIVREAQQLAVEAVRPGIPAGRIDAVAREHIAAAGYGDYFTHRVGHGIGLEIHEPPYLTGDNGQLLEPGMAFSVEPGIYLPGRFGVRIEDTVLVTESGGERLNHASRELLVVA